MTSDREGLVNFKAALRLGRFGLLVRTAMLTLLVVVGLAAMLAASPAQTALARAIQADDHAVLGGRPSTWSDAVTGICANALLFEGSHQIGTRAGAVAVARDIRASTARRLRRIRTLQVVPPDERLSTRWLKLEHRLAAVYASSYLGIYDAIAAAETPRQQARLPLVLNKLLHSPDALRAIAQSLEQRLHVPDCTGGATPHGSGPAAFPSEKE